MIPGKITYIKKAYELKETYRQWFQQANKEKNAQKIKKILDAFPSIYETCADVKKLVNWDFKHFFCRYSNGFLEGINNK